MKQHSPFQEVSWEIMLKLEDRLNQTHKWTKCITIDGILTVKQLSSAKTKLKTRIIVPIKYTVSVLFLNEALLSIIMFELKKDRSKDERKGESLKKKRTNESNFDYFQEGFSYFSYKLERCALCSLEKKTAFVVTEPHSTS